MINATNVQSGVLWRFSKPYMRDYRVGEVKKPAVRLSQAVAASSAFPPVLSPVELTLPAGAITPGSGKDLERPPSQPRSCCQTAAFTTISASRPCGSATTLFVSDAGGLMAAESEPHGDWARHARPVLDLVDNQVRSLRKRQLIRSLDDKKRKGAYWGIRTDIARYGLPDVLPCPHPRTMLLADEETRLRAMGDSLQEKLINWGYAVCDAAIRRHFDETIPKGSFPYPSSGV